MSGSPNPHLPMRPVAYPAAFSTSATVTSSGRSGGPPLPRTYACPVCRPVIRQHRDGAHTVLPA